MVILTLPLLLSPPSAAGSRRSWRTSPWTLRLTAGEPPPSVARPVAVTLGLAQPELSWARRSPVRRNPDSRLGLVGRPLAVAFLCAHHALSVLLPVV